MVVIIPRFAKAFADFQLKLPSTTEVVLSISDWMVNGRVLLPMTLLAFLATDGMILFLCWREPKARILGWLWFVLIIVCPLIASTVVLISVSLPLVNLMEALSR